MQSIVDIAAKVELIPNLSQVVVVSPTDPRDRPADQSRDDILVLDQENSNFE